MIGQTPAGKQCPSVTVLPAIRVEAGSPSCGVRGAECGMKHRTGLYLAATIRPECGADEAEWHQLTSNASDNPQGAIPFPFFPAGFPGVAAVADRGYNL